MRQANYMKRVLVIGSNSYIGKKFCEYMKSCEDLCQDSCKDSGKDSYQDKLIDVDMVKEVKDFYKKFVGYDMTDEEATNMLTGKGPKGE